jgi:hypothetical protein
MSVQEASITQARMNAAALQEGRLLLRKHEVNATGWE